MKLPKDNLHFITIFFGTMRIEEERKSKKLVVATSTLNEQGKIDDETHPWALQFKRDLEVVAMLPEAEGFYDLYQGNVSTLFKNAEVAASFIDIPVEVIRARFMKNEMPEGIEQNWGEYLPKDMINDENTPDDPVFKCELGNCDAVFDTQEHD